MSFQVPTREPSTFRLGDTLHFTIDLPDFRPADGWTLKYNLTNADYTTPITGTDNGDGTHKILVAAATTGGGAPWYSGEFRFQAFVEGGDSAIHTVREGSITLLPKLTAAIETRSTFRVMLDDAKAALSTFLSTKGTVASYSIGNRSMSFKSSDEILELINALQAQVDLEKQAEDMELGLNSGGTVKVEFR